MATAIILPPSDVLATAAAELAQAAHDAGDKANENALNKAAFHLHQGLTIVPTTGGFLMPSGTRSAVVHRISHVYGCNCEASSNGRACWHMAAIEIIEHAQTRVWQPITRSVEYERALAEMQELYG